MSTNNVNTNYLRHIKVGQYMQDKEGNSYKVMAIYNKDTPAQQFLLEGEHYPQLISELAKLGYTLKH